MTAAAGPAGEPVPSAEEITRDLCRFFATVLGSAPDVDEDYFASGRLSSLAALELVVHVERGYGFRVGVEDLDLDNFRTIRRITRFVQAKSAAVAAPPPAERAG